MNERKNNIVPCQSLVYVHPPVFEAFVEFGGSQLITLTFAFPFLGSYCLLFVVHSFPHSVLFEELLEARKNKLQYNNHIMNAINIEGCQFDMEDGGG